MKGDHEDPPPSYDEVMMGLRTARTSILQSQTEEARRRTSDALQSYENATVRPYLLFNAKNDAQAIKRSKNKEEILDILCHRTESQRIEIANQFYNKYGVQLTHMIRDIFGSEVEDIVVLARCMPLCEFLARFIQGCSNELQWICDIVLVLSNEDRTNIMEFFKRS